ncbi:hypothetical protein [Hathewaya limosa]|uniref:Magnesium-transporting ATPase (P-type) n=1 Tax=Hathewaya limosa TaxID=1536 RepID=A0ABU0JVX0_HATLI|nr:hypothetical protein [Hathewaya limosa]MDQ0480386.1 magnesium-transporting ATPase (P-type) [Hathewaya limosa]
MIKKASYVMLNIIMFFTVMFSLWIYMSHNPSVSWYENSGIQFLALIIISLPLLLVILGGFMLLKIKGFNMKKNNLMLPVYIIIGTILPVVIDGSLNDITIGIGTICCVISLVKIIIDMFQNFRLEQN